MKIDDDFQGAFDGLMLGDGCIAKARNYDNFYYDHGCKYRDWLDTLKLWFLEYGFSASVHQRINHPNRFKPCSYISYRLYAGNKAYFACQRKRWYIEPDGECYSKAIKTVPEDIFLTPKGVANWYMGDGSFTKSQHRISFAVNGFLETDVDFLCSLLEYYVGIETHKNPHPVGYMIRVSGRYNVETLVDYMRPYVCPVYMYKIP